MQKLFFILKSARGLLVLSQILSFGTILFNVLLLATSAWLISTAALHPELGALGLAIVGVRFYGISRAVARYGERYFSHNMAFQGLYALRTWLYRVIEPLAPGLLRKYGSGDLLGRIMADIEILQFFFLRVIIPPMTAFAMTFVFGWYLGGFSLALTGLLWAAFFVTGLVAPYVFAKRREPAAKNLLGQRARVKETIVESLRGMMDIVAYNSRDTVVARLYDAWACEDRYRKTLENYTNLNSSFFLLLVQVTMFAGLLIMASVVENTHIASGVYIAVVAIGIQAYFEALMPMGNAFYHWRESRHAMDRIMAIAQETPAVSDPEVPADRMVDTQQGISITFQNMCFAYEGKRVFEDFSLALAAGERVAIVGPSGAGKSTLFALLERFYPYEGSVLLGGVELQSLSQAGSRNLISMVNQEPYIFHASLEDNIRMAKPEASVAELNEAIQLAGLRRLVDTVGLHTMVGGGGSQLSGGERQRIALARLFLSDHPLWLLDEPLEGLDQVTRSELQANLLRRMEGKTVLYITHQLRGLEAMDRIVFLERGQFKEVGSYAELMAKRGAFYDYVMLSMASV